MPSNRSAVVKIVLDFVLLLTVGIPLLVFFLAGNPYRRGFNCDDDSIRYKFKESTISNKVLYVVGVFLPVCVICITEFTNAGLSVGDERRKSYNLLGRPIPNSIWMIYKRIGVFLFGACMSQLSTDIAKYSIGRLRPHFLDVCNPNVTCDKVRDPHEYIENYYCRGPDEAVIREARLSFPSGHSSFSAYTMVFTVLYLHAFMNCRTNKLLKPFLQFILLMMTWYTSLSRISDYKHHWSDVLTGFLLGTVVALITVFFVSDFFQKREKSEGLSAEESQIPNYNTMERNDLELHKPLKSK